MLNDHVVPGWRKHMPGAKCDSQQGRPSRHKTALSLFLKASDGLFAAVLNSCLSLDVQFGALPLQSTSQCSDCVVSHLVFCHIALVHNSRLSYPALHCSCLPNPQVISAELSTSSPS